MKGLCYHTKGSRDYLTEMKQKGSELIKDGLRQNVRSSMCWRVKGVAHKADGDLPEAVACYSQAMRYDNGHNERILNEIANMQLELQKYPEFEDTRHALWQLRPEDGQYLVAELMACFLSKRYQKGLDFLTQVHVTTQRCNNITQKTIKPSKEKYNTVQLNDIYLLQARMYKEKGDWDTCLKFLEDGIQDKSIRDLLSAHEIRLQVHEAILKKKKAEQKDDDQKSDPQKNAVAVLKQLLDINPENTSYYHRFMKLVGFLKDDSSHDYSQSQPVIELCTEIDQKVKKCSATARIMLDCSIVNDVFLCCVDTGDEFKKRMDSYMRHKLSESVLSLYKDLQPLYREPEKAKVMDELVATYLRELKEHVRFSSSDKTRQLRFVEFLNSGDFGGYSASPSCLLWTQFYNISRQLDIEKWNDALALIDESLALFPTCLDLYDLRARVYKYCGNPLQAFEYLDIGRQMDLADRFLNTKCTRYALRAGKTQEAEDMVRLFLKKTSGVQVLHELEVMWYELHKAESHLSKKELGPALREFEYVFEHFNKFYENQVDFHKYAYRRVCIMSYLNLLQWENNLRSHPFYRRACVGAIEAWLVKATRRIKNGTEKGSSVEDEQDKRHKRGKDPRGWELIHGTAKDGKGKHPLEEAHRWIKHWVTVAYEKDIEPHEWYVKVQRLRWTKKTEKDQKDKIKIDTWKSIKQVCLMYDSLNNTHRRKFSLFLPEAIQFLLATEKDEEKTTEANATLIQEAKKALLQVKSSFLQYHLFAKGEGTSEQIKYKLIQFVNKYSQQVQSLLECTCAYRLSHLVNQKGLAGDMAKKLVGFIPQSTLKECVTVKKILEDLDKGVADDFKSHCKKRFVLASVF
ncbi:NMDA receptor-regulated protein [Reticulomyxa filosa]|uniref:NMDA receptor-regulated protein n=1 Tax=Reticulomyxa filosa TaxID=46433 RepID=X6L9D4_RETFI|nr:NMDA receptor-regulated protein [Reticulomyxa filosa]|eukprot:ETN97746.1 NMDA receptor-regulated protein [Reticulomyxa filosa]